MTHHGGIVQQRRAMQAAGRGAAGGLDAVAGGQSSWSPAAAAGTASDARHLR